MGTNCIACCGNQKTKEKGNKVSQHPNPSSDPGEIQPENFVPETIQAVDDRELISNSLKIKKASVSGQPDATPTGRNKSGGLILNKQNFIFDHLQN